MERALVEVQTTKLLNAGLVKLSKSEYASTIVMLTKKNIFGNWIEHHVWGLSSDE